MVKKFFLYFPLIFYFSAGAFADITVELILDRKEASIQDTVKMVVRVSGSRNNKEPLISGLDSFSVQSGGTSTRMQIINGSYSTGIDFTYYLEPNKIGEFTIGPAVIEKGGKSYRSNTRSLAITKSQINENIKNAPIFLRSRVSKKNLYEEEAFKYTLKLYHLLRISNLSLALPKSKNLTFQKLGKRMEYQARINNVTYDVLQLDYLVRANSGGKVTINPSKMAMIMHYDPEQSGSLFGEFFQDNFFSHGRRQKKRVSSLSHELTIHKVPLKGKPDNYAGLVGAFQIESGLTPANIKSNESTTLTITIKGYGNIKRIPDLVIPKIENIKVYSDKPSLKEEIKDQGIFGAKVMKWAIVPQKAGTFFIPEIKLSYFDTTKGKYKEISTRAYELNVLSGGANISSLTKEDLISKGALKKNLVTEVGRDIFPIRGSMKYFESLGPSFSLPHYAVLYIIIPILAYLILLGNARLRIKKSGQQKQLKSQKALKSLLSITRKTGITAGPLFEAIKDYFNDRLALNLGTITLREIEKIVNQKTDNRDLRSEIVNIIQELEEAVYTGKAAEKYTSAPEIANVFKKFDQEVK